VLNFIRDVLFNLGRCNKMAHLVRIKKMALMVKPDRAFCREEIGTFFARFERQKCWETSIDWPRLHSGHSFAVTA